MKRQNLCPNAGQTKDLEAKQPDLDRLEALAIGTFLWMRFERFSESWIP